MTRTGAAATCAGYFHEAAMYGSDAELIDVVVPFLRDAVAAGEPALVTLRERNAELVRRALGGSGGVEFLPPPDHQARPASTIRDYRRRFADLVAAGAAQIRVVGEVPHPGTGSPWQSWARYEVAVNHAFDDFPIWGMCPYDLRTTPDHVLDLVAAAHPHLARPGGAHEANAAFDPAPLVPATLPAPERFALEHRPAAQELVAPSGRSARAAAARLAAAAGLPARECDDLALAVSEVVVNASMHGAPPVVMRGWHEPGRAVIAVSDAGPGPSDACVGLVGLDRPAGEGGFGLWLTHQLCADVTMHADDQGFTMRLVAGRSMLDPAPGEAAARSPR